MSKYEPLTVFLKHANGRTLRLSFGEIEKILGFELPASKQYPAWWSNSASNNTMTQAWLSAGYKTEQVDVDGQRVTFRADQLRKEASSGEQFPSSPLFGSMKGTTFVAPGVDLTAPTLELVDPGWMRKYEGYDPTDVIAQHEVSKIVSDPTLSTSDKIRALHNHGVPRAEIAKLLNKRYQHVRNVLVADELKARRSA
ncbi:MAG: DUF7662 domain-containing protein [Devosia sp.]